MKTTVELPDQLLKSAKSMAAQRGVSLKQFIVEALKKVIADTPKINTQPAWMRCFGEFRESRDETAAIQTAIDKDFSRIDSEEWR